MSRRLIIGTVILLLLFSATKATFLRLFPDQNDLLNWTRTLTYALFCGMVAMKYQGLTSSLKYFGFVGATWTALDYLYYYQFANLPFFDPGQHLSYLWVFLAFLAIAGIGLALDDINKQKAYQKKFDQDFEVGMRRLDKEGK